MFQYLLLNVNQLGIWFFVLIGPMFTMIAYMTNLKLIHALIISIMCNIVFSVCTLIYFTYQDYQHFVGLL